MSVQELRRHCGPPVLILNGNYFGLQPAASLARQLYHVPKFQGKRRAKNDFFCGGELDADRVAKISRTRM